MYQDLEDAPLIQLICSGSHEAFTELVNRHTSRYFKLAYQTLQNTNDAEDVVQNAFIKFWQNPRTWNARKSSFTTWFYRVILNACHDIHRKNKYQAKAFKDVGVSSFDLANELESGKGYESVMNDASQLLSVVNSEELLLERKQKMSRQKKCLEYAISQLPDSQRDALNLVVYSELPQKQAAIIMGISLKALESHLVRAKKSLSKTVQIYMDSIVTAQSVKATYPVSGTQ